MTGGMASLATLMVGTFTTVQVPPEVTLGLFLLGLFVAFFLAWRDAHRDVAKLRTELQGLSKRESADFQVTLEEAYNGSFVDDNGVTVPIVMVIVSILTRRSPSVASSFRLSAKAPIGLTFEGTPVTFGKRVKVDLPDGSMETLRPEQSLFEVAGASPIPQGALAIGNAIFTLPGVQIGPTDTPAAVSASGTVYEIRLRDAWSNEYTASLEHRDGNFQPRAYPGLHRDIQRPKRPVRKR